MEEAGFGDIGMLLKRTGRLWAMRFRVLVVRFPRL